MPGYYSSFFFIYIHLIEYYSAGNVGHVRFLSCKRKFDICTSAWTWVITVFIWATQWVFCWAALMLYNWNWSIAAFFLCVPLRLKEAIWLRPLGSCWVAPMYSHGMLSEGACFFNHLRPDAPNWWASKLNIGDKMKNSSAATCAASLAQGNSQTQWIVSSEAVPGRGVYQRHFKSCNNLWTLQISRHRPWHPHNRARFKIMLKENQKTKKNKKKPKKEICDPNLITMEGKCCCFWLIWIKAFDVLQMQKCVSRRDD